MMESNMMVVPRKRESYNYTMMEEDDSIDSDDDQYNYVIDLDYKEEESTTSESENKTDNASETSSESPEPPTTIMHSPKEVLNLHVQRRGTFNGESSQETDNKYTPNKESVLDLSNTKEARSNELPKAKITELPETAKNVNNYAENVQEINQTEYNYTLDTESIVDLSHNQQQSYTNTRNVTLDTDSVVDLSLNQPGSDSNTGNLTQESVVVREPIALYIQDPNETLDGKTENSMQVENKLSPAKPVEADSLKTKADGTRNEIKSVLNSTCNKSVSAMEVQSKPVGASKRKRKFNLEGAISNMIKVKSICTRDISYCDNDETRQSSSMSASLTSPTQSNSLGYPRFNHNHFMSVPKRFPADLFTQHANSLPPSTFNHLNSSEASTISKSANVTCISTLESPRVSSIASSTPFTKQLPISPNATRDYTNQPTNLTQKSVHRRKSSVVYRADKFIQDANTDNSVLDMSVKKENVRKSPSFPADVMDLSKRSMVKGTAEVKVERESVEFKHEPVDLTYNSKVAEKGQLTSVKKEPETQHGNSVKEQLNVMDIFKDMISQNGGVSGGVSMPQFVEWMRKIQPMAIENMNMMQLNAYYMQFCYWMQTIFNNSLMNGVPNGISYGVNSGIPNQNELSQFMSDPLKKGRRKNSQRKSLPTPFRQNNSSPLPKSDNELSAYPGVKHTVDLLSQVKSEKTLETKLTDFNSNCLKPENVDIANIPEFSALKDRYSCQISERDGKLKFMVKDNGEIHTIATSIVQVADLTETEMQSLERDENGLCPRFICRICDQKFFHQEHMSKHVKTTHIQKRYQCDQCERSFHDAGNYRQHVRVHDETDVPYQCPECSRRFRHKCTLKVHMRIHTGEKPFQCNVCEASFKISSGLQTHMRKHTGETPYACEYCSLRFKCQSNLKQHLFQHTQSRPFPCEICGKAYSRKSIRDSHMLTHYRNASLSVDLNVTV